MVGDWYFLACLEYHLVLRATWPGTICLLTPFACSTAEVSARCADCEPFCPVPSLCNMIPELLFSVIGTGHNSWILTDTFDRIVMA